MRRVLVRLNSALLVLVPLCGIARVAVAQAGPPAMAHPHMSLTATRPGTAADTARALAVVARLRTAIAPYQTLEAATAAGFRARRDSGTVMEGQLLHMGRGVRQKDAVQPFDPSAPQALLYRRGGDGRMQLAGAMYVAPLPASLDSLDAMIPLSVAHWHRHLNVCISAYRGSFRRFPNATTAKACETAGGRFRAESRYMIHVMIDAGNDLTRTFPQGQEMAVMDMGSPATDIE